MKKVSLIVPAYNEEKLISKTLEGMPQSADRIYVVDDGSTDSSKQLVEQLKRQDDRIQWIQRQGILKGASVCPKKILPATERLSAPEIFRVLVSTIASPLTTF